MTETLFTASSQGIFTGADMSFSCAIGKGGMVDAAQKSEGDGGSPLGTWPMRRIFYRPDRLARPQSGLPCIPLRSHDGWCDAPDHPLYNRPVALPFSSSHERLWREDHVYDIIVEIGHNDTPAISGLGSAIFLHLAHADYRPTEGCIAIALDDMRQVLMASDAGTSLQIVL